MDDLVLRIQDLGKKYSLGQHRSYQTLREALTQAWQKRPPRRESSEIWALRNVSLEVRRGEVVGIIGRNGAGKSTLLKILSRVTSPTEGRAIIRGRVGSLLEVGTGFHPELTGRENIFLNGAILGMPRSEIRRNFDAIVSFAEVAPFIDTPVKRYSSGMYVRLAFAVAAHLKPDILIVDEVLAVGDAHFQKKCLGKMEDVATEGRTVLFVSHNMPAVTRLCSRAVLLEEGRLVQDGNPQEVVGAYLRHSAASGAARAWDQAQAPGTEQLKLLGVRLTGRNGRGGAVVDVGEPLELEITYRVLEAPLSFRCAAMFFTQGTCVFTTLESQETEWPQAGLCRSVVEIPPHLLAESEYTVTISIFASRGGKSHFAQVRDAIAVQVTDSMNGSSARGDYAQNMAGVVRPKLAWRSEYLDALSGAAA